MRVRSVVSSVIIPWWKTHAYANCNADIYSMHPASKNGSLHAGGAVLSAMLGLKSVLCLGKSLSLSEQNSQNKLAYWIRSKLRV